MNQGSVVDVDRLVAETFADPAGRAGDVLWCLMELYQKQRNGFTGEDALHRLAEIATPAEAAHRLTSTDVDRIVTLFRQSIPEPRQIEAWQVVFLRKAQTDEALDLLLAALATLRGEGEPKERREVAQQIVNGFLEPGFLLNDRMLAVLWDVSADSTEAGDEAREILPAILEWRANSEPDVLDRLLGAAVAQGIGGQGDGYTFAVLWGLLEEYEKRLDGMDPGDALDALREYGDDEAQAYRLTAGEVDRLVAGLREAVGDPAGIEHWHVSLLRKTRHEDALALLLAALAALRGEDLPEERRRIAEQLVNALGEPTFADDPRVRALLTDVSRDTTEAGDEARELLPYLPEPPRAQE